MTVRSRALPRRVATMSVHTSPLEQPGTGDAGGMNVYIVETARRLAEAGVEVEIFTRSTTSELPARVQLEPGVTVRHIQAGPYEGLSKDELPGQLCAFAAGVLQAEADQKPGYYDLVHSHYWLSGQVGWLAQNRWGVPLVHTAHTLAKVKNAALAHGDRPEPRIRVVGEQQVVDAADQLVANTAAESRDLVNLYGADPDRVTTVLPGVDLRRYVPGDRAAARAEFGFDPDAFVLAFVGRIQPLKAPDVVLRAAAEMIAADPAQRRRLVVAVCGGPSGSGLDAPEHLAQLSRQLGIADVVRLIPPLPADQLAQFYRAADVVTVPSHNESFGLVALEAQACGTPVAAAAVGGLVTAVRDGLSGILIDGHEPRRWARELAGLRRSPQLRASMSAAGVAHARRFSWSATVESLLQVYSEVVPAPRALAPVSTL